MGTPASIKFTDKPFMQLYSHYDGYPEGIALKLYAAFNSFDFDPQYLHTLGNASLLNQFIAANIETLSMEAADANTGAQWVYLIDEQAGTIEWGRSSGGRQLDTLALFVNEQMAAWVSRLHREMEEKPDLWPITPNSYPQIRNFSPAIQNIEQFKSPLYLTVDKSQTVCTALLEEASKWELTNPKNPNIKNNLERVKQLNSWAQNAAHSQEAKIIRGVGNWMDEQEGAKA